MQGGDRATIGALGDVARRHGVRLLCLHGSRATGRQHAGSDLDLAAWYADPHRARSDERELFADLPDALPAEAPPLDVAVLDLADPLLQFMVAREGTPLMEERPGAFVEFAVRAAALYRDTAPYRGQIQDWSRLRRRGRRHAGGQAMISRHEVVERKPQALAGYVDELRPKVRLGPGRTAGAAPCAGRSSASYSWPSSRRPMRAWRWWWRPAGRGGRPGQ